MAGMRVRVALGLLYWVVAASASGMIHRSNYEINDFQNLEKSLAANRTLSLGWFGYAEDGSLTIEVTAKNLKDPTLFEDGKCDRGVGFIIAKADTPHKGFRKDLNVCNCTAMKEHESEIVQLKLSRKAPALTGGSEDSGDLVFVGTQTFNVTAFQILALFQCNLDFNKELNGVKLSVKIQQLNPEASGKHLQVGDRFLPEFYFTMSMLMLLCFVKWVQWMRADPEHTFKIHYLMGAAVALKAGSLFFEAIRYYHYREEGGTSDLYEGMYYTFNLLKGAMIFAMMILFGSGWSYLKPCLTDKEKMVLLIVIPLQVTTSVLTIVLDEYFAKHPEENTENFQSNLTIISFITCCIVFVPIIWSMNKLRAAQNHDGKVARNLVRMKKFQTLYIVVLVYVYTKTLLCEMILTTLMPAEKTWVPVVLGEACVLVSFICMGMRFKPEKENPFSQLDDDDIEDAGPALAREMHELQQDRVKLDEANQPYPMTGQEDRKPVSTLVQKRQAEADF